MQDNLGGGVPLTDTLKLPHPPTDLDQLETEPVKTYWKIVITLTGILNEQCQTI